MYLLVGWIADLVPWWIAVLVVLGLHAFARRYVRDNNKHLIFGKRDVVLLASASFFLIVVLFILADEPYVKETTWLDFWSLGLAASAIGTVALSVQASGEDRARLQASLAAKSAILLLLPLLVLPVLLAIFGTKRDRRFRDGTKGNARTELIALSAAGITWLITSMLGPVVVARKSGVAVSADGDSCEAVPAMHRQVATITHIEPMAANVSTSAVEADEVAWLTASDMGHAEMPKVVSHDTRHDTAMADSIYPESLVDDSSAPDEELEEPRIHIARNGVLLGDFERSRVQSGIETGLFLPSDDAWVEDAPSWVKVSDLPLG